VVAFRVVVLFFSVAIRGCLIKKVMVHKRSDESKKRRNERKQKRPRFQTISVPHTKTDRERYKSPEREKYVSFPFVCQDLHNGVLIHFLPKTISLELIATLENSTNILMESFPPPTDRTCRGEQKCYYFGHWRDSSFNINMCPNSKNSAFPEWLKCNNELFTTLSDLLKMHYPSLYAEYSKLDEQYRLFGIWSMAILNIDSLSTFHIDTKD